MGLHGVIWELHAVFYKHVKIFGEFVYVFFPLGKSIFGLFTTREFLFYSVANIFLQSHTIQGLLTYNFG